MQRECSERMHAVLAAKQGSVVAAMHNTRKAITQVLGTYCADFDVTVLKDPPHHDIVPELGLTEAWKLAGTLPKAIW